MSKTFATYSLTTQLGNTSQGETYRAFPPGEPDNEVVIKIFHPSCLGPGYEAKNFLRDAARMQHLTHPHLLPVLDADIEQRHPFVVSSYLPQGSLRARLRGLSPARFSVRQTLRLGIQLGQALSYCHANNLLHGHLTPDNVLWQDEETALLADWGLAPLVAAGAADASAAEDEVDHTSELPTRTGCEKSDQFALGCLLYEVLTGTQPFAATTGSAPDDAQPPSRLVAAVPKAVDRVLLKALDSEPTERYESVAQLVEALEAVRLLDKSASGPLAPARRNEGAPGAGTGTGGLSLDAVNGQTRPKAPVFPFAPEASVSYRDILSSLQLEEAESPLSPEPEARPAPPAVDKRVDEDEFPFDLWNPREEDELWKPKKAGLWKPQEDELWKRQEDDDTEEQSVPALSAPDLRMPEPFLAEQWEQPEEPRVEPDAEPVAIASSAAAVRPNAVNRTSQAHGPLGLGLSAVRFNVRPPVSHTRGSLLVLLVLALLLAGVGFLHTYLFAAFVPGGGNLALLATPQTNVTLKPTLQALPPSPQPTRTHRTPTPVATPKVTPTPVATPKPTSTPAPTPTATPTRTPTAPPASTPTTAPPSPTTPPETQPTTPDQIYAWDTSKAPVTLDDALRAQNGNNWQTWSDGNGNGCSFTSGAYQAAVAESGYFIGCMAQKPTFTNFVFQAEMTITSGTGGGLIFRTTASATYRFRVDADGHYDLAGLGAGQTVSGTSSAVHTGANQMNLLTVIAYGSNIYMYVNKQFVAYINDTSSSSGSIGFLAIDAGSATNVLYRNAKVWLLG